MYCIFAFVYTFKNALIFISLLICIYTNGLCCEQGGTKVLFAQTLKQLILRFIHKHTHAHAYTHINLLFLLVLESNFEWIYLGMRLHNETSLPQASETKVI